MADEIFTPMEIDTIGEIMNISMGSAATAASTLLDDKVTITTPVVQVVTFEDFRIDQLEPAVAVEITYVEGISGSNILILRREDIRIILSMMMMTELPEDFEVDEMAQSAICELMNQMMGSSATVLSCFLGRTINISTPAPVAVDEIEAFKMKHFGANPEILTIAFELEIADKMKTTFLCAMQIDLAKEIIDISLNFGSEEEEEPAQEEAPPPMPGPVPQAPPPMPGPMPQAPPPSMPEPMPQAPPPAMPEPMPQAPPMQQPYPQQPYPAQAYGPPPYPQQPYPPPGYGYPPPQVPAAPIKVQDFNYSDFGGDGGGGKDAPTNLDLIMGVPVMVTVELGRTKRKIKEILEFGQGTIVELDKQAGSQVDVIVNGQLIARGDVVVVDDNFSIRITEILRSRDSLGIV